MPASLPSAVENTTQYNSLYNNLDSKLYTLAITLPSCIQSFSLRIVCRWVPCEHIQVHGWKPLIQNVIWKKKSIRWDLYDGCWRRDINNACIKVFIECQKKGHGIEIHLHPLGWNQVLLIISYSVEIHNGCNICRQNWKTCEQRRLTFLPWHFFSRPKHLFRIFWSITIKFIYITRDDNKLMIPKGQYVEVIKPSLV